ncbi:hypothetical protein NL676_010788 [Syzygium grande]|nr:hypothetical protein NL676_010788 [Syzygium grande]
MRNAFEVGDDVPKHLPVPPSGGPGKTPSSLFWASVEFNLFVELYERNGMEWLDYPLSRRPPQSKITALESSFPETSLSLANFVYPLFIHEGEEDTPIGAMPGCYRLGALEAWACRRGESINVAKARDVGVNSIVLFPKVPDSLKSPTGDEAYNDNGLAPRTIRLLEDKYPDLDLDLKKPGVRKFTKRWEFEVTTAEVLRKADFRRFTFSMFNFLQNLRLTSSLRHRGRLRGKSKPLEAFGLMPFTTMGTKSFIFGKTMENLDEDYEYEAFEGRVVTWNEWHDPDATEVS